MMIKLLIVDDSSFMRRVLRESLTPESGINIVGEAADGREALEKVKDLQPDVVLLDIIMPVPDGLGVLEKINKLYAIPVIIFSAIASNKSGVANEALKLGVINIVRKPQNPQDLKLVRQELIEKIKAAALIDKSELRNRESFEIFEARILAPFRVIAVGSSAGGPPAVRELLHALPCDLGAGVLVAQHIPESFVETFCIHLREVVKMGVKVAEDGDIVTYGRILVSPALKTLTVHKLRSGGVVRLADIDSRPRPSVDVMFESVAETYGRNSAGVVLSGMGSDGTKGLKAIKAAGGRVFAQDEKTSLIWGMPRAALESGVVERGMPVTEIARELIKG